MPCFSGRRFLDVIAHPADDIRSSVHVPDNTTERFPDLNQIWRTHFQKPHPRTGIVARRSNRVQNFVSQRGGQFSHSAHAVHVSEIRLHLLQARQRSCAIFDVCQQTVPARDTPGLVANWGAAIFKPPIFAINSSQA